MPPVNSLTAKVRVLHCLDGNVERTCREIAQILNLSEALVGSGIRSLVSDGRIEAHGRAPREPGVRMGAQAVIWRMKPQSKEVDHANDE